MIVISKYSSYSREVYVNQPNNSEKIARSRGLVASQGNCLNGLQRLDAKDIEVSPVDGHNVFIVEDI